MYQGMLFIYLKTLIFTLIIFLSGMAIIRRATKDNRLQILAPTALIFGLSLYLFLTNAFAYFIKGSPLFYISLAVEIILALIIHIKQKVQPLEFPTKTLRLFWIISAVFWGVLLFIITNTSPFNGGHDTEYQSFAALFTREGLPLHAPWQPNYIAFLHLGASQLLGSFKILTGANYYFIQAFIAFLALFSCSQILTWLLDFKKTKSFRSFLILSIPPFAGIISVGSFMLAWPAKIALPDINGSLVNWLTSLPALEMPNPPQFPYLGYLDYISIDAVILFLQRVTAMSFFIGLLPVLLSPSENKKYLISIGTLVIFLATIALTDESVLIPAMPAVFFIAIFTFRRLLPLTIFVLLSIATIAIQGGTVTEVLLDRYKMGSGTLILPGDRENPFEKFRSWRLAYQSSYLYDDLATLQPFRWFRVGIIWLLGFLLFMSSYVTLFTKKENNEEEKRLKLMILIMFFSSLGAFLAFHIIVPNPFHTNGWRFLFLSYKLAGIGVGFSLIFFWGKIPRKFFFLKFLIVWILIFSFVPSFLRLFPRRPDLSWITVRPEPKKQIYEWVKQNIPISERILALTDDNPTPSSNMNLVKQIGAYTPIWPDDIRNYDGFDISPTYIDLYYTLNPNSLKKLKPSYLIIDNLYLSQLSQVRKSDIFNSEFFQPVLNDPSGEVIVKILPKYLEEGKNLKGTLEELEKILPKKGSFFIDHKSAQEFFDLYRPLLLILRDRKFYGVTDYWNSRLSINIPFYGISSDHYDYIVGGHNLDIQSICHCQAELLWSGLDGRVNLWKTK